MKNKNNRLVHNIKQLLLVRNFYPYCVMLNKKWMYEAFLSLVSDYYNNQALRQFLVYLAITVAVTN